MKLTKASIVNPIVDSLVSRYQMIYGKKPRKDSIEFMILEETKKLEKKLTKEEILLLAHTLLEINLDLVSNEKKLWREFVYIHLVFLKKKEMLHYPIWLFRYICTVINRENIRDNRLILLLSNEKWMMKVFHHCMLVDYSSSLVLEYKISQARVMKVFLFLCKVMENALKRYKEEPDLNVIQKEIFKLIKTYQTSQLFQRSVV